VTVAEKNSSIPTYLRRVPSTVRLAPSFVASFYAEVRARLDGQIEAVHTPAGLLFGSVKDRELTVEHFKTFAVTSDESSSPEGDGLDKEFEQCLRIAKEDRELATLELIGWYGVHSSVENGLLAREIEFHNRHFRRISDLALVVSCENNSGWVQLYTRLANTAMSAERHRSARVQLANEIASTEPIQVTMGANVADKWQRSGYDVLDPLHRPQRTSDETSLSAKERVQTLSAVQPTAAQSAHIPMLLAPDLAVGSTHRRNSMLPNSAPTAWKTSRARLWIVPAVLLAMAGTLSCVWLYFPGSPAWIRQSLRIAAHATRTSKDLGMRVESKGDALLIGWNPHSEALQSATRGMLDISDGSQHHDIYLDPAEIANGSVLYRPASPDVVLRLIVSDKNGTRKSEDVRVLNGSNIPPAPNATGNPQSSVRSASAQPVTQARHAENRNPSVGKQSVRPGRSEAPDVHIQTNSHASSAPVTHGLVRPSESGLTSLTTMTPQPPAHKSEQSSSPQIRTRRSEREQQIKPSGSRSFGNVSGEKSAVANSPGSKDVRQGTISPKLRGDQSGIVEGNAALSKTAEKGLHHVYVPPRPTKQVMPSGLSRESLTYKPAPMSVEVTIDEFGRVTEAHVANGVSSDDGSLITSVLSAAKEWVFSPATVDGQAVSSHHTIEFRFNSRP
jgi:TonB family protein